MTKWKLSKTDLKEMRLVGIHPETDDCHQFGCVVHHWSKHHMREMPLYWRDDAGKFERICPHGIGHPDPDGANYLKRRFGEENESTFYALVHGCCGICCIEEWFTKYADLVRSGIPEKEATLRVQQERQGESDKKREERLQKPIADTVDDVFLQQIKAFAKMPDVLDRIQRHLYCLEQLVTDIRTDFNQGLTDLGAALDELAARIAVLPDDPKDLTPSDLQTIKSLTERVRTLAVAAPEIPVDGEVGPVPDETVTGTDGSPTYPEGEEPEYIQEQKKNEEEGKPSESTENTTTPTV
jgi:phage tail protein X